MLSFSIIPDVWLARVQRWPVKRGWWCIRIVLV